MTARATLPAKRTGESFVIEYPPKSATFFRVQVSEYPDGQLGEVFINGAKPNSSIDNVASDIAILISLLLQHGAAAAAIGHALRRNPDGTRASIAGVVVDALSALDRGEQPDMVRGARS
jgi:hypothetical protein